ncbi:hypothetical protein [Mesoflavibacter sp. CH_XMU1404-2]|uniref:hypothetical protein n=1 Tax=Mesoflavibacter sp. CH_XMU1404-2 TaxID=3107766 RepID=UPI00244006BA
MEEIIIVTVAILIIIYSNFIILRKFYRFLKGYMREAIQFAEENNLVLVDLNYPTKSMLKNNPFKVSPSSFIAILISSPLIKYQVVDVENKIGKTETYWMKIEIFFFRETKIIFKKQV